MEAFSKWSTNFLVHHQAINEDDREVFEYGFQILFGNIVDFASLLIFAIVLHKVPETLLYHMAFIPLRQFAGGYHAATRLRCFIISTLIWLVSLWLIEVTSSMPWLIGLLTFISCCIFWMYAPIEHANNPLSETKRCRMRHASRIGVTIVTSIIIMCMFSLTKSFGWVGASLAYGAVSSAGTMVFARITK